MADNSKCFSLVRGRVMRVTRLDGCGVDPALIDIMTGQPIVNDAQDVAVGFRMNSAVDACDSGFALEVWSSVPAAVCEPGQEGSFGYFLVPFVKGGIIGDFTIANDVVNFSLAGAKSKDGSAWGVGPYDVARDENSLAGPLLTPIDVNDHLDMELTTVAPPDAACGSTSLGTPAVGADAGTPGTFTPDNSYGPESFDDLGSLTANPSTAWTTGQHVVLRDGSLAYWDGTAWVEGSAP